MGTGRDEPCEGPAPDLSDRHKSTSVVIVVELTGYFCMQVDDAEMMGFELRVTDSPRRARDAIGEKTVYVPTMQFASLHTTNNYYRWNNGNDSANE